MTCSKALWLFALWLGSMIVGVRSWSRAGHSRIAEIAAQLLEGKKRARVKTMMKGDIMAFASWEEVMLMKYPATKALHEHRQEPEWFCNAGAQSSMPDKIGGKHDVMGLRCTRESAEPNSLFCALAFFFEHFAHDALLDEYPKSPLPVLAPESLGPLADLPKTALTPSEYLRWLSMLLGDLHQPLHLQRGTLDYGRDQKVVYLGKHYTLSEFWEELPKHFHPLPKQETLYRQYTDRAPKWWDKRPTELFREWANETSLLVCSQIYAALQTLDSDGINQISQPVTIQEEVFHRWVALAEELTTLAAQRLAFLLSDILVHRKHKQGHKEGRGHTRERSTWRGLMFNVFIATLLVPVLLLIFKWHFENPSSIRSVRQNTRKE